MHEMHSESECPETEDVQVFIITTQTKMFDIIETWSVRWVQISLYNRRSFTKYGHSR